MRGSGPIDLEGSVYRTFIVLVAPALNTLGWRLDRPKYWFIPENGNDADARIVHDLRAANAPQDRAMAIVETRALGSDITSGIEFHLNRCIEAGIPIFVITDGRLWHLYPIVSGVCAGNPTAKCNLFTHNSHDLKPMAMLQAPAPESASTQNTDYLWIPLPDYEIRKLDKPAAIMFPDGSVSKRLRNVYDVQRFIVDWLHSASFLDVKSCPITTPRGAILVNTKPEDANGNQLKNHAQTNSGFYINIARDATNQQKAAMQTINALGLQPADFKCRRFM